MEVVSILPRYSRTSALFLARRAAAAVTIREMFSAQLLTGSVAQAARASELRRRRAAAPLRARAARMRGSGEASSAGLCYSTMSFLRLWTNATTSRCSPSGTWNFARVAAA
jgi:hypothetical protein